MVYELSEKKRNRKSSQFCKKNCERNYYLSPEFKERNL